MRTSSARRANAERGDGETRSDTERWGVAPGDAERHGAMGRGTGGRGGMGRRRDGAMGRHGATRSGTAWPRVTRSDTERWGDEAIDAGARHSHGVGTDHDRVKALTRAATRSIALFKMARVVPLALPVPNRWGGARPNAGRKPGTRRPTPHRARPRHRRSEPVHVTLRSRLAPLRSQFLFPVVRLALSRASRRAAERFRIVHFSVQ